MKVFAALVLLTLVNYAYSKDTTVVNSCHDALLPEVVLTANNTVCAKGPCIVKPGSDVTLTVSFTAPTYLEHIKPKIIATAIGVELEYPLGEDDACVGILNTNCPVSAGELVEYAHTMHILDIFPEAAVTLTFTINDEDNNNADVVCFVIDIQFKKT
uniref:MD-2-related lipid-recognition domain-containing protein n=2 Tax=Anoplophora glabripennis TaxID=217634 RepID=V5I9K2_ANOGL